MNSTPPRKYLGRGFLGRPEQSPDPIVGRQPDVVPDLVVEQQPGLLPTPVVTPCSPYSPHSPPSPPLRSTYQYPYQNRRRMNPEWYQESEERANLSSEDEGNFADDFSDEEPDEARVPLPKSPVRQPTPLMTQQSTPSPTLTTPLPVTRPTTPEEAEMTENPPPLRPMTPPRPEPAVTPRPQFLNPFVIPVLPPDTKLLPLSSSFWQPTVALQLTPDNTLQGQRELIRRQVEEIRKARDRLTALNEEIAAADQHQRDIGRQRAAILATVVAYDDLRKRRRLTDAKMKKERASEKDFRDAVIELYSVLRRDDD